MQGDTVRTVHDLSGWAQRVQTVRETAVRMQAMRDTVASDLIRIEREVERLTGTVAKLTMTGELLRLLMDKLVLDQVKAIESVVTEGLRSIFFDQDLSFEAEVGTFRNKIAIDLLIRREQNGIEIVGPPLETMGGGVSSIASLTLRLLALMRLKKFPLLLLDETLSAVSDDYVDATGQFLGKLAQKTNIPILLVTHKQAYLDHAKTAYQGHEESEEITTVDATGESVTVPTGGVRMVLKKLRGAT